jgi:hypothetical protein
MKGFFPWLVRWICRAGTSDFVAALVDRIQHIFSSLYTISIPLNPIAYQAGQAAVQAAVQGRLPVS